MIRTISNGAIALNEMSEEQRVKARREAATYRKKQLVSGDTCIICGFEIYSVLRLHHIYPVSYGGNSHPENMILLCPNCHALVHEFAAIMRTPTEKRSNQDTSKLFFGLKEMLKATYTDEQIEEIIHYADRAKGW